MAMVYSRPHRTDIQRTRSNCLCHRLTNNLRSIPVQSALENIQWIRYYPGINTTPTAHAIEQAWIEFNQAITEQASRELDRYLAAETIFLDRSLKKTDKDLYQKMKT